MWAAACTAAHAHTYLVCEAAAEAVELTVGISDVGKGGLAARDVVGGCPRLGAGCRRYGPDQDVVVHAVRVDSLVKGVLTPERLVDQIPTHVLQLCCRNSQTPVRRGRLAASCMCMHACRKPAAACVLPACVRRRLLLHACTCRLAASANLCVSAMNHAAPCEIWAGATCMAGMRVVSLRLLECEAVQNASLQLEAHETYASTCPLVSRQTRTVPASTRPLESGKNGATIPIITRWVALSLVRSLSRHDFEMYS
jgi:hypothetical protein